MAAGMVRKNASMLRWLRAALAALATYAGLLGLHFSPAWGAAALGLLAGVLTLASADLGILVAIVALALPLLAVAPVSGITFMVLSIVLLRYVGARGGRAFFIIALALAGAAVGPVWAAAAVAGYLLGVAEGALAAALSALVVQAFGIALGRATLAATVTGGTQPLFDAAKVPASLFEPAWVTAALNNLDPAMVTATMDTIVQASPLPLLLLQPVLWAAAAAVAGTLRDRVHGSARSRLAFLTPAAAALVPAVGIAIAGPLLGARVTLGVISWSALTSAALAAVIAWIADEAFPLVPVARPTSTSSSMAAEDADVDELLSLISTAEERLATEHTVNATVMITDMKSFSRMTEEDGSMLTAKAIQRHRDLLLPVIQRHGGHGKSTGGDGLVAAFDTPAAAVAAAAEMQSLLASHNAAHPDERDLSVRIGLAEGEVVLDKGGRPFIGAALNLAARVMNLADGGQAFVSSSVAKSAGTAYRLFSHGTFELKNISEPVEVFEVLWREGQQPIDPRERLSA